MQAEVLKSIMTAAQLGEDRILGGNQQGMKVGRVD